MKNVKLWTWSKDKGLYYYKGNYMEEALILTFEEDKKSEYYEGEFNLLEKYIQEFDHSEYMTKQSNIAIIEKIFLDEVTLDFDFAYNLKPYDIIYSGCLVGTTDVAKQLIGLIESAEIAFILHRREFHSMDNLEVSFITCHADHAYTVHGELSGSGE